MTCHWGFRVVVPAAIQGKVLQELHKTHPEMTRMKSIARSYVWWSNIDSDIEETVRACHVCQATRANPPEASVHSWCYPTWQRLLVDFKGPMLGRTYLVAVDAYGIQQISRNSEHAHYNSYCNNQGSTSDLQSTWPTWEHYFV